MSKETGSNRKLCGVAQAAETLGISVWTIRAWAYKGKIASHKLGDLLMFSDEELQRVIDSSERPMAANRSGARMPHSNERFLQQGSEPVEAA